MEDSPKKKLLDQMCDVLRLKHYARKTEESYLYWARRYILISQQALSGRDGTSRDHCFLDSSGGRGTRCRFHSKSSLQRHFVLVSRSPAAPPRFFRWILFAPVNHSGCLPSCRKKRCVSCWIKPGTEQLIAQLLYGTGLRVSEAVQLRIKDIDFAQKQILVRDAKRFKDRVTVLPQKLIEPFQHHLARVK